MEGTNWKRKVAGVLDGKGKELGETKQEATIGEADKKVDCKEIEMKMRG